MSMKLILFTSGSARSAGQNRIFFDPDRIEIHSPVPPPTVPSLRSNFSDRNPRYRSAAQA
jgi:hypothetical protein